MSWMEIKTISLILTSFKIHHTLGVYRRKGRKAFYNGKMIISKKDLPLCGIYSQKDVQRFLNTSYAHYALKRPLKAQKGMLDEIFIFKIHIYNPQILLYFHHKSRYL